MKTFGVFLIILGLIGGVFAFQMDTSVSTGYSEYSRIGRVSNLSLMEERRTYLMVSGLSILAGVLLFGFGSIRSSGSGEPNADSDLRACPFCAEHIKKAATVCRFCNRDVPQIVSTDGIGPSGEAVESNTATKTSCWTCTHFRQDEGWFAKNVDSSKGICRKHSQVTLAYDTCPDHSPKNS